MHTRAEIRPLHIPDDVTAADAADFVAMTAARNRIYAEISGNDDEALSPSELLPHYAPDVDETRCVWVVVVDGEVVGRVGVDIPHEAGSKTAHCLIELCASAQGRGLGDQAFALVTETARAHGRTVLQSWAEHPEAVGARQSAPTGFGSVPLDRAARFALRHGFALEQVERKSVLDLRAASARIDDLRRSVQRHAVGYRVVTWTAPTPAEWIDGYALLKSRMSTDVPAAAMVFDEERWDAARVTRHDARVIDAGRTLLVTAAVHEESGALVAFNELAIGPDRTGVTHQEDTLVLREHRGHRLGMLVKCAGLQAWREIAPDSPRVLTYNAEENRPMLDINEAVGFEPAAAVGAWKRTLSPDDADQRRR